MYDYCGVGALVKERFGVGALMKEHVGVVLYVGQTSCAWFIDYQQVSLKHHLLFIHVWYSAFGLDLNTLNINVNKGFERVHQRIDKL